MILFIWPRGHRLPQFFNNYRHVSLFFWYFLSASVVFTKSVKMSYYRCSWNVKFNNWFSGLDDGLTSMVELDVDDLRDLSLLPSLNFLHQYCTTRTFHFAYFPLYLEILLALMIIKWLQNQISQRKTWLLTTVQYGHFIHIHNVKGASEDNVRYLNF